MQPLAPYIQQALSQPARDQIFGPLETAPQLDQTRTNRIIVYPGSFNPPHRGHLHLLSHTFCHGVHDLNVIAAIVLPSSEESLSKKRGKNSLTFTFRREERCYLWKNDPHFPEWAWVFEPTKEAARNGITQKFTEFVHNLQTSTSKDGYEIDFVYMYGPDHMTTKSSWEISHLTLLCDAARKADYQRSCGRLRDFEKFTSWKRLEFDNRKLEHLQRKRTQLSLAALETIRPNDAQRITSECLDYVDRITRARVVAAKRDLLDVVCCKDRIEGTRTLRFIKYKGDGSNTAEKAGPHRTETMLADEGTVLTKSSMRREKISSTKLRDAMRTRLGVKLGAFLYNNALSPATLWWYLPKWLDKTRNGSSGISFLPSPPLRQELQPVVVPPVVVPTVVVPTVVVPKSRKRALSVAFGEEEITAMDYVRDYVPLLQAQDNTKKMKMMQEMISRGFNNGE